VSDDTNVDASTLANSPSNAQEGDLQVIEIKRGAAGHSAQSNAALHAPVSKVLPFKAPAEIGGWAAIRDNRAALLRDYQNAAYAARYVSLVDEVARAEQAACGSTRLAEAVARYSYKLMAYKDEYEVARLYSDGAFIKRIEETFEGDWSLRFHLAPPMFSKRDAQGHLIKRAFGPSTLKLFGVLARLRGLRGTVLDVFGYTGERRAERALIEQYRDDILGILPKLSAGTLQRAVDRANLPEEIRGYGHVKEAAMARAAQRRDTLMAGFDASVTALADARVA